MICLNRRFQIKILIALLALLISAVFFVKQSLAYFDQLQSKDSPSVPIGEWNRNITNQSIVDYLNQKYHDNVEYHRFVLDGFGSYSIPEERITSLDRLYESFTLNVRYQNYPASQIYEMIDEVMQHANSFLTPPSGTNPAQMAPTYPTETQIRNVPLRTLTELNYLEPGESKQKYAVINSADLRNNNWMYDPFVIQVVLASKNPGVDISDYLVEVFIDTTFITGFSTQYLWHGHFNESGHHIDRAYLALSNLNQYVIMNPLQEILTTMSVRTTPNGPFINYNHRYLIPQKSGKWMRFPDSRRYDIYPTQPVFVGKSGSYPGLILNGNISGYPSDVRVMFAFRFVVEDVDTVNIPLAFVLSRAQNSSGNNTEVVVGYRVLSSSSPFNENIYYIPE